MKYEFLRRQKMIIIAVVTLCALQGGILFGLYKGEGFVVLAVLLFILMIYGSGILLIVDTARNYSIDLNKKEGYMLFLTPNSGHKIIISKLLTAVVFIIITAVTVFLFSIWNANVAIDLYYDTLPADLQQMIDFMKDFYKDAIPSLGNIILMLAEMLVEFVAIIVAIMFSITVRKTILSNARFGWLLSILIFVLVFSIMGTVNVAATWITGSFGDYMDLVNEMAISETFDGTEFSLYLRRMMAVEFIMNIIYLGTFTFFSGVLLNKRVDL